MAGNEQISSIDRINELRRELEVKIDKKVSDTIFGIAVVVFVGAIGGIYYWLMNMNERITRVETKIEITQPLTNSPVKK